MVSRFAIFVVFMQTFFQDDSYVFEIMILILVLIYVDIKRGTDAEIFRPHTSFYKSDFI